MQFFGVPIRFFPWRNHQVADASRPPASKEVALAKECLSTIGSLEAEATFFGMWHHQVHFLNISEHLWFVSILYPFSEDLFGHMDPVFSSTATSLCVPKLSNNSALNHVAPPRPTSLRLLKCYRYKNYHGFVLFSLSFKKRNEVHNTSGQFEMSCVRSKEVEASISAQEHPVCLSDLSAEIPTHADHLAVHNEYFTSNRI